MKISHTLFFLLAALLPPLSAAVAQFDESNAAIQSELDVWQGSSLGIRLDLENPLPEIIEIYPHVKASSPFQVGDKILSIGELSFPEATITELSGFLNDTKPGTDVTTKVTRNENELELKVEALRKEFVDIHAIHRRLSNNRIIEQHLEQTNRKDLLDKITGRMATAVGQSNSPREASEAINRIIDEIGVSHTAIIPSSAGLSFSATNKGGLGLLLQRHEFNGRVGYFVIDKKPGSSSFDSDLLVGDEILTINNVPIAMSRRLDLSGHEDRYQLFKIDAKLNENVTIEYLRSPFDDSDTVQIRTEKDPSTVGALRASAKTVRFNEMQIGYLRFWNLMTMAVNTELSKKVKTDFAECSAIILDLRGRGGIVPAVMALNRSIKKIEKPVIVIIDDLTRSAKEMLAYLLKKQEHVLVIGTKTAGAVTGATMMNLPSGNSLMFPVASADSLKQFIDGTILEGVGVEPDERVEYFIPYSAGGDRLYETALKRAAELVIKRKATTILD